MKTRTVIVQWESQHDIEVPDDWEWDGTLKSLLEFDEILPIDAYIMDWDVT